MVKTGLILAVTLFASSSFAQDYDSTVRDVTHEYTLEQFTDFAPTPTPAPNTSIVPGATPAPTISPIDINPNTTNTGSGSNNNPINTGGSTVQTGLGKVNDVIVTIDRMITTGQKVWDFLVSTKPNATYETFTASVVPEGITSWTQLNKWSKPVSKVFRVEFTNAFGGVAGSFDYRITYFHSGSYKGKGKFIGQISVVPMNIQLRTDRSFKLKVEIGSIVNYGEEGDPVAGAQLIISWATPTTTSYQMRSAEYMIYGTGEFQDLTNGN